MGFNGFSRADVEVLKASPSEPLKIKLIDKLHESFYLGKLNEDERLIAEEILRFLAADISVRIRQSIATRFCDDLKLPYDVALNLANDLEDVVAVPIIENASILQEADLIAILEAGNTQRQKAIARRNDLNQNLTHQLITKTNADVVTVLVNNKNATITANDSEHIISNYSISQPLLKAMITNKRINANQAHELLTMVSADLRKVLIVEYQIPSNVVNNLVHDSKETMIMNMIMANMQRRNHGTLMQMINKLHEENELTFSVLIKALSFGNLNFFETAIAKLSATPLELTRRTLWNGEANSGFNTIYLKAHLPEAMAAAVYKLMAITKEELAVDNTDAAAIHYRILNRLARTSNNETITNLDYLVTIVAYNLKKSNLL